MVYSNHHLAKKLFAIILAFAFVICFVPTISEASYGAASSTSKQTSKKSKARKTVPKPGVLNLYVNTEVSQKAVPAKKKRRHYRRVQLTWSPSGKATTYIVYGTWNTKVKVVKTKTIKTKVKVNGKEKTIKKKKTSTSYVWKQQAHELTRVSGHQAVVLAKNNKPVVFTVIPYNGTVRGNLARVTTYAGDNNATAITLRTLTSNVPERSNGAISVVSNNPANSFVSLTSSNSSIAAVTSAGVIQAKKIGSVNITATAHNGLKRAFRVNVIRMYPTKVTIAGASKRSLKSGATMTLIATAANGANRTIKWKSSNKNIATVTSNGVVKAVGCGTVKITASGGHFADTKAAKAKVTLNVTGNAEAVVVWAEKIARDNRFGYSMNTSRGRLDRFCYFCHGSKVSKDYDCASFVAAAVAHGLGDPAMLKYCRSSGGCTTLYNTLKKNGWKDMGKLSTSKLKRGDILINPSAHVEIFTGKKNRFGQYLNAGAHDNYDGKSGDSSGREISIAPTAYFNTPWHHYTKVLRLNK